MTSLLPINRTASEKAVDDATARMGDVPVPIGDLWDAHSCPASLLPWLAWALSVDNWHADWTEGTKRDVLAKAVQVHRQKGTVAAVRAALDAAGFGDARIIERWGDDSYDAAITYDGTSDHQITSHWAQFRVRIDRAISIAQGARVRDVLAIVAPARCHLDGLNYSEALNLYNGAVTHDGVYSHGVA